MTNKEVPFTIDVEQFDIDPHPIIDQLRTEAPISYQEWMGGWFAVNWEDVEWILTDTETFETPAHPSNVERAFGGAQTILSSNGPLHRDIRAGVEPPLRAAPAREYSESLIRPVVQANIQSLLAQDTAELMSEYFDPISVRALGTLIGLDEVDDDALRRLYSGIITGIVNIDSAEEGFVESDSAVAEIREIATRHYDRLLKEPDRTTLSHLIHGGRGEGNPRTLEEILPTLTVYIAGGMQEPGHGACSALYGLLNEPEQLKRVIEDPTLVTKVVQEGLRWIPPICHTERTPKHEVEIAGKVIQPGEMIFPFLMAANRDPKKFTDPHRFNIDREEERMVAFGGGAHLCAGHFYARHVMRIALEELLAAFPNIKLNPEVEAEVRGFTFRAPRNLNVILR